MEQKGIHSFGFLKMLGSVIEQNGIGSFGFLKVIVLQWNSHPHFLIYLRSKSKVTQNISDLQEWHQKCKMANLYSRKDLFTIRREKTKTCSGRPHLCSGCFIKVFYKTTPCPRWPLLNGPKSSRLTQVWLYYTIHKLQKLQILK